MEQRDQEKLSLQKKREKKERKIDTGYKLIFPSEDAPEAEYQKYIDGARSIWEDFNQGFAAKHNRKSGVGAAGDTNTLEGQQSGNQSA